MSALAFGLGIDQLYQTLHISPRAVIGEAAELIPESLKYAGAVILLALSVKPLSALFRRKRITAPATRFESGFPTLPKAKQAGGNGKSCHMPVVADISRERPQRRTYCPFEKTEQKSYE